MAIVKKSTTTLTPLLLMLPAVTTNAPFVAISERSGTPLARFRSESTQEIAIAPGQASTAKENNTDKVTLSKSGIEKSRQTEGLENANSTPEGATTTDQQKTTGTQTKTGVQKLTPAEEKVVQELKVRDQEVKTHEMAHVASAGQYARGGPTYSYQQGPDGQRYAIGGEVPIDLSKEKTPEQTIQKMQIVKRAAMAPAEPSAADRSVAAAAAAMETQARQEVQTPQANASPEQKKTGNDSHPPGEKPLTIDAAARSAGPITRSLDIVT